MNMIRKHVLGLVIHDRLWRWSSWILGDIHSNWEFWYYLTSFFYCDFWLLKMYNRVYFLLYYQPVLD